MKVKIFFKGILKGSWLIDFVSEEVFKEYLITNSKNILKYEII